MFTAADERCAPGLLAARRRYFDLRASLPCDCELDLDLHAELTELLKTLDTKIARLLPGASHA